MVGALGRMGRQMIAELERAGEVLAAAVDPRADATSRTEYTSISDVDVEADVIIDFSRPDATEELLKWAVKRRVPVVIATTGHGEENMKIIAAAAKRIPVFLSSNLSYGVHLFADIAKNVAKAFPYADVEIVETHHSGKADVPSGTALTIAKAIIDARGKGSIVCGRQSMRQKDEVGISSLRLGGVVGRHEVRFDTGYQTITLVHEAAGRTLYTRGAINAMRFLVGVKEPRIYGMEDLIAAKKYD